MLIFQFIPLRNPKTTGRLLEPFPDARKVEEFDLEDSFWVFGSPERGQELKRAREQFRVSSEEAGSHFKGSHLRLRENPVGSDQ